jgi:hypothetical protein
VLFKTFVPEKLSEEDDPGTVACKTYIKEPSENVRPYPTDSSDVEEAKHLRARHFGYVPRAKELKAAGEEEIAYGTKNIKTKVYQHNFAYTGGVRIERRLCLAPEVPFGVAKFAWKVTLVDGFWYSADLTITKDGKDATPQLPVGE